MTPDRETTPPRRGNEFTPINSPAGRLIDHHQQGNEFTPINSFVGTLIDRQQRDSASPCPKRDSLSGMLLYDQSYAQSSNERSDGEAAEALTDNGILCDSDGSVVSTDVEGSAKELMDIVNEPVPPSLADARFVSAESQESFHAAQDPTQSVQHVDENTSSIALDDWTASIISNNPIESVENIHAQAIYTESQQSDTPRPKILSDDDRQGRTKLPSAPCRLNVERNINDPGPTTNEVPQDADQLVGYRRFSKHDQTPSWETPPQHQYQGQYQGQYPGQYQGQYQTTTTNQPAPTRQILRSNSPANLRPSRRSLPPSLLPFNPTHPPRPTSRNRSRSPYRSPPTMHKKQRRGDQKAERRD